MQDELRLMAAYNRWMNARIYAAASGLDDLQLAADRGAYFGSLLATLNHILVADLIWLHRYADAAPDDQALAAIRALPKPIRLDQQLYDGLATLWEQRRAIDAVIEAWLGGLTEIELAGTISYASLDGVRHQRRLSLLLMHFFNHQTHHRGQASTLLHQAGIDIGATDLVAMLAEMDQA